MGYPIEGVTGVEAEGGGEAEQPIAALLATADPAKGEQVFKKCTACHTINQGGANGTGPNLWATLGAPLGHSAGFPYSSDLKALGGTWDWEKMNQWLKSPKALVPGTKMSFAGLGKAEDRANVMAYLNSQGSNLPLPPPPAAAGNPAEVAAEAAGQPAAGDKGEKEPILNEAQVARQPEGNAGGEGVPSVAGTSKQER
jgi:cytochrome c